MAEKEPETPQARPSKANSMRGDRPSALDKLKEAKANLEQQKNRSARRSNTMSAAEGKRFVQQQQQQGASSSDSPSTKSDFLRKLRESKPEQERSSAGSLILEERKRLKESGLLVKKPSLLPQEEQQQHQGESGEDEVSVLDVLQAGSVIGREGKKKKEEKKAAGWVSAQEQKRTLSTIKRTKEEKLKALEQLQLQLQKKRSDISAIKEKQKQGDHLLAQMVLVCL